LHDAKIESFGPAQGERLSRALVKRRLPWNQKMQGRAGRCACAAIGSLLSPDAQKIEDLIPEWKK
jgi:hypothetical protein